jgi:UDP-N-acetylmuramoyl-L-alanyl-D-glutamate--2,6-diaminopimelate ligase
MMVRDLFSALQDPVCSGDLSVDAGSIAYDSRRIKAGTVFVALRGGKADGHDFISKAIEAGASAIVAETAPPEDCHTAWAHVKNCRAALADLAAAYYGHPSESMFVGGVTGTNGKTTTAFLMHHLLNHAQLRCGLLGTVVYDVGGQLVPATHTTPESLELQGLLADMRDNGCRSVAMEVSSHALDQHRVRGVKFNAAVWTNLTQDHLDYHHTMEAYFAAKAKLFEMTAARKDGRLIINADDKWGRGLIETYKQHAGLSTYGFGISSHYRASSQRFELTGTTFEMEHAGRSLLVRTPLIGQFNIYNSLAAVAAAHALGCNLRDSVRAMQTAPQVPGRMERVSADNMRFHIFVDYAHTPDGLINALSTARALRPNRLVTVFGCGGDRDRSKRPLMARAVEDHSDVCILTSDNPRTEDPRRIMEDARKGFTRQTHTLIVDRREAIHVAIANAKDGDLIVIAGKGHETYQDIKGLKHDFDDRLVSRHAMNDLRAYTANQRMEAMQKEEWGR